MDRSSYTLHIKPVSCTCDLSFQLKVNMQNYFQFHYIRMWRDGSKWSRLTAAARNNPGVNKPALEELKCHLALIKVKKVA